jgi:hypothetical protein
MSFCTVINCMDGRVQLPVLEFMKKRFQVDFVDSVTEAGPVRLFANKPSAAASAADERLRESVLSRVLVSTHAHASKALALVAHAECAGNPRPKSEQLAMLERALVSLRQHFPEIEVIALWLDADWKVQELV